MRVLLLGASGQLGRALTTALTDYELIPRSHAELDLTDLTALRAELIALAPDAVVNAAAYTAVDRAESERDVAFAVNAAAPAVIAEYAAAQNVPLIHYSTDYVYDGNKPDAWSETDATHPLNVYGQSKLAGDLAIEQSNAPAITLRTSWVYAATGRNFLTTMLRLAQQQQPLRIVNDQHGAPTSAASLAAITSTLLANILNGAYGPAETWRGIYHTTCAGTTTWHGFAEAIFALHPTLRPKLIPIPTNDFPTPALRPRNSVLSNAKLHTRFGLEMPDWKSALEDTMATLGVS